MRKRRADLFCFYCDAPLSDGRIEWDHFPIPKEAGGKDTVPTCLTCHDMKDRYLLESWNASSVLEAFGELRNAGRNARLLLAKMLRLIFIAEEKQKKVAA